MRFARSGRRVQARAGVLTGEAAVTLGATKPGDGRRGPRQHRLAAAVGCPSGSGARRRGDPAAAANEPSPSSRPGSSSLRAKPHPVPAWRAVCASWPSGAAAIVPTRSRHRSSGATTSCASSRTCSTRRARESRARLVSVIGPAGIGKSRLAWEFLKYVDGLVETVWWHDGRSPGLRRRDQLLGARRDGPRTGRPARDRRRADHAREGRRDPGDPRARPRRAALDRARPPGAARRGVGRSDSEQLFGAWRTFFERLAATAPVVHGLRGLPLRRLRPPRLRRSPARVEPNVPIYVVTLSRPELLERRPDLGRGQAHLQLALPRAAARRAMRELLAGLVPGLPEAAVQAIVARADGIPLYAVETVRMLARRRPPRARGRRLPPGRRPDRARRARTRSPR